MAAKSQTRNFLNHISASNMTSTLNSFKIFCRYTDCLTCGLKWQAWLSYRAILRESTAGSNTGQCTNCKSQGYFLSKSDITHIRMAPLLELCALVLLLVTKPRLRQVDGIINGECILFIDLFVRLFIFKILILNLLLLHSALKFLPFGFAQVPWPFPCYGSCPCSMWWPRKAFEWLLQNQRRTKSKLPTNNPCNLWTFDPIIESKLAL